MRRYLIISLIAVASCNNTNNNTNAAGSKLPTNLVNNPRSAEGMDTVAAARKPMMVFKDTLFDFGAIKENERVSHEFAFTNEGKTPLIITSAAGSCGCTVADYPRDPVPPGSGGIMKVTFNSTGKHDHQDKSVSIHTNSLRGVHMLYIKGDVTPKSEK